MVGCFGRYAGSDALGLQEDVYSGEAQVSSASAPKPERLENTAAGVWTSGSMSSIVISFSGQ